MGTTTLCSALSSARPRALTTLLLLLLVTLGLAAPARAAGEIDPDVLVSRDGTTWTAEVQTPLFQPDLVWQPGDVRTSTLWVRNVADRTTDLEVVLSRPAGVAATPDDLVSTSGSVPGQPWTVVEAGGLEQVVRVDDVQAGESAVVTLRTSLAVDAPAGTLVDAGALQVSVRAAAPASDEQAAGAELSEEPSGSDGADGADDADTPGATGQAAVGEGWLSSAHLELAPVFLGIALIGAVLVGRHRGQGRSRR